LGVFGGTEADARTSGPSEACAGAQNLLSFFREQGELGTLPEAERTTDDRLPAEPAHGPAGDAAAASAAIENFLRQRSAVEPNWHLVFSQMRDALQKICASKLIRSDDKSLAIIKRMIGAQNMEDLAADIDRLGERVAELTGYGSGRRRGAPIANVTSFEQRSGARRETGEDADQAPMRMVLRL
jgi:hypothetical protein